MAFVNINLDEKEEILLRTYSMKAGKSLSDLLKVQFYVKLKMNLLMKLELRL